MLPGFAFLFTTVVGILFTAGILGYLMSKNPPSPKKRRGRFIVIFFTYLGLLLSSKIAHLEPLRDREQVSFERGRERGYNDGLFSGRLPSPADSLIVGGVYRVEASLEPNFPRHYVLSSGRDVRVYRLSASLGDLEVGREFAVSQDRELLRSER